MSKHDSDIIGQITDSLELQEKFADGDSTISLDEMLQGGGNEELQQDFIDAGVAAEEASILSGTNMEAAREFWGDSITLHRCTTTFERLKETGSIYEAKAAS